MEAHPLSPSLTHPLTHYHLLSPTHPHTHPHLPSHLPSYPPTITPSITPLTHPLNTHHPFRRFSGGALSGRTGLHLLCHVHFSDIRRGGGRRGGGGSGSGPGSGPGPGGCIAIVDSAHPRRGNERCRWQ